MAEAHIAALLPTQNRVVGTDANTVFLAHYDLNEHDVLRNVNAMGETKSIQLAGTAASYVEAQHIPAYNVSALTIEAWIKVPSSVTATYRLIVGKSVGGRDFNFYVYSSNATQITHLHMSSVFSGSLPALPTPFELNTWHHIAVTVSPTGYISYYADGVFFGGMQGTATTASRTSPIKIGADDNFWNGNVSNVKIWNRALSSAEINVSMNGSLPSEQGLIGYWKLNEGQGIIAQDLSAFHNDAMIYSGTWDTGNSVFTLRPKEGYFGGSAMAIEESTTNYMNQNTSTWNSTIVGIDASTYKGYPVYYADGKTGGSGWLHANTGTVELAVGAKAVYSMWMNRGTADKFPAFYGQGQTFDGTTWTSRDPLGTNYAARTFDYYNENGDSLGSSLNYSTFTGWVKVVITFTNVHTDKIRLTNMFFLDYYYTSGRCYHSQPQIEMKGFPTSFINGTRATGNLKYPPTIFNKDEFTVSLWVKLSSNVGNHYLVSANSSNTNRFNMYINDGSVAMEYYNGTIYGSVSIGTVAANQWNHVVFRYSKTTGETAIFLNGVKSTGSATMPTMADFTKVYIGTDNNGISNPLNGLIDELRIDNIARTDAEITAWYYSNSPFWPRGIYRKSY